jgi:hypothetical protein
MEKKENNVVLFPLNHRVIPAQSLEQVMEKISEIKKDHVDFLNEEIMEMIVIFAENQGFNVSSEECLTVMDLVSDAIDALLYQSIGIKHDLHDYANEIYKNDEIEEVS